MADLVTSESRRYLHGIQKTVITDDDTGVAQNEVPEDNQLALVDELEVLGTLTVYGDVYVTASKNAGPLAGVSHNGISGRDVYAAHPASAISFTPVAGIAAVDAQSAIYEVESHVEVAQTTANDAATAAAYADRLARSSNNLIKNGNSADPNPTGYEAVGVATIGYYTISPSGKVRMVTGAGPAGQDVYIAKGIPVENPGDQYYFRAYGCRETAAARDGFIGIFFFGPTGAVTGYGYSGKYSSTSEAGAPTLLEVSATAPAGTATVGFCINSTGPAGEKSDFNLFYACRKVSAGMLEADAVRSTTSDFKVLNTAASTSTTTGAIVAAGGIATGDYFTGKHRSSDGTAGLSETRTFYSAPTSGGSPTTLNTVTIKDGIITSWTQE